MLSRHSCINLWPRAVVIVSYVAQANDVGCHSLESPHTSSIVPLIGGRCKTWRFLRNTARVILPYDAFSVLNIANTVLPFDIITFTATSQLLLHAHQNGRHVSLQR